MKSCIVELKQQQKQDFYFGDVPLGHFAACLCDCDSRLSSSHLIVSNRIRPYSHGSNLAVAMEAKWNSQGRRIHFV